MERSPTPDVSTSPTRRKRVGNARMNIFVDESGTFSFANRRDSWCVIAAYVVPDANLGRLQDLVTELRRDGAAGAETKLRDLDEQRFTRFLLDLRELDGLAFFVAADVGLHRVAQVERHRNLQAAKIRERVDRMVHEEGRRAVSDLADAIGSLPLQLYTQLTCQLELFHKVLVNAPVYFVQRDPSALSAFRWRIDQKAKSPTKYERTFRQVLAAVLQTKSLREPMMALEGADYSHFSRFEYPPGEAPEYLARDYGIHIESGINVGMMVYEDFQFVDSDACAGVQAADLLAGGLRRLLRGGCDCPDFVAAALGANTVQAAHWGPTVTFMSLDRGASVTSKVARFAGIMGREARPLLFE